jgi:hypothetical protein
MRRANGELFWCHVTGRALDPSQPLGAGVWTFEDVSEKRPVSAELTPREREVMDTSAPTSVASTGTPKCCAMAVIPLWVPLRYGRTTASAAQKNAGTSASVMYRA